MEDERIVALYWERDEGAIRETEHKYGRYLRRIAGNILVDRRDSEESVNDTYLKAWNSMPPQRPGVLAAYLGRITRQLSIDIYRMRHRAKREAGEYALSLSELEECVSGQETPEERLDAEQLARSISSYLYGLPQEGRCIFAERYFYADSIKDIARAHGMSVSKVKSMLFRIRKGLREQIEREGFAV